MLGVHILDSGVGLCVFDTLGNTRTGQLNLLFEFTKYFFFGAGYAGLSQKLDPCCTRKQFKYLK
jgi:hypothetical protein